MRSAFSKNSFKKLLSFFDDKHIKVINVKVFTDIWPESSREYPYEQRVDIVVQADKDVPFDLNNFPFAFPLRAIDWNRGILSLSANGIDLRLALDIYFDGSDDEFEEEEDD